MSQVNENKIKKNYFELYTDIANNIKDGLITKPYERFDDFTAKNQFTRDIFEELFERFIKDYTAEKKFTLS